MVLDFLTKTSPIDEDDINWIFTTFAWALENFDADFFQHKTQLIVLDENFFPGSFDSVHAMANGIFERVQNYCGLAHWPFELVEPEAFEAAPVALQVSLSDGLRGQESKITPYSAGYQALPISYQAQQINKPDALAASFAHGLAQHQLHQRQIAVPGGEAYRTQATEMIAVMMGFGLLMANTAYTFRGSCASCYNPAQNRQASLPESHAVYALALFCQVKGIDHKIPLKQLKKHLRSSYKKAYKDVQKRQPGLALLGESLMHSAHECRH